MKLKDLLTNTGPKPLFKKEFNINKSIIIDDLNYLKDEKKNYKNNNKIFYIIRRSPGSGLFSNLTFVLNHIIISEKFGFIPIIDMQNFTTIYNEKKKINGTFNAWEYYFEKINKYTLDEVYKSKNKILISSNFQTKMIPDIERPFFSKALKKIKVKKKFNYKANEFFKKNFDNKDKILGVHFRGSTYKTARGHAFPPTPSIMIENIENLILKYKYNKIFLVTEEQKYLNLLKSKFKKKIFYYDSFRMKSNDSFKIYPRLNHRYKLGEENIIESILLSKCDGITYIKSNLTSYAKMISKKKIKDHEIFLGFNSRNKYIARWKWYLKYFFPYIFGKHEMKYL